MCMYLGVPSQVLRSVAQILGYRSPENLVMSHLDYLVTEWLRQRRKEPGYTLESFPYALLGHVTLEDFYRFVLTDEGTCPIVRELDDCLYSNSLFFFLFNAVFLKLYIISLGFKYGISINDWVSWLPCPG